MTSLLLQLVALGGGLLLALPPGWCAGVDQRYSPEQSPVEAACCHQPAENQPSDAEAPAKRSRACCCSWDATAAQRAIQPSDEAGLMSLGAFSRPVPDLRRPIAEAGFSPGVVGPRLHVLQCVWRC